ncbi:MAG: hypothetical protein IJZ35_02925 [Clostridia bacterium]|nr:hypothetical protein [Clostridia bacterium]
MKKIITIIISTMLLICLVGCDSSTNTNGVPDPEKIVPKREILIENLEDSGYTIKSLTTVEGSDLIVDRIIAKKESKFIDIIYGLSAEDSAEIFELYCELYSDDYYILAQNGNYVYCVSDKKTFKNAGFTTTDNVGVQYIHN